MQMKYLGRGKVPHYIPWYMGPTVNDALRKTSTENPRGLKIFSTGQSRSQFSPKPNSSGWKNDPTLKKAPRRMDGLTPAVNAETNRSPRWLLGILYAETWISDIIVFFLTFVICFVLIGILAPSLLIARSPGEVTSKLCNLPLVRMLPLCPSSETALENPSSGNDTCRRFLFGWTCTSNGQSYFINPQLYQDISSTQEFLEKKLMEDPNQEPMAMKIQLGLHLVKQSNTHLSFSDIPSTHGILEAYTGLITDLDRSLRCLQRFKIEVNYVLDALYTGLPHLSRELAKLQSKSIQRLFLTKPLLRSSDEARMLELYLSHMKSYDNQTTDLLIKGHSCFMQLPSLEADWLLVGNLTANASRSLRNDMTSLTGPFSRFLPLWMLPGAHTLRVRELSRQLGLLHTLYVLHVQTWRDVGSVAHDLEEIEMEISQLEGRFSFESLARDVGPTRSHLHLALVDARNAETEMRDKGLRKSVLFDRLWEKGQGERELMDPL